MMKRSKWHESLTGDVIIDAVVRAKTYLDNPGFCLACGAEAEDVEPDARKYKCHACDELQVYGAEELLLEMY